MATRLLLAIAIAAVTATGCGGKTRHDERVQASLKSALTSATRPTYVTSDAEGKKLWKLTQQFYERRHHAPAWIDGTKPNPQMAELMNAVINATHEGLDPQLYNIAFLEQRRQDASKGFLTKKGFDPDDAGAFDVWLTYLYLKYASDLADGLSDLAHADPTWKIKSETVDPSSLLANALANKRVQQSLTGLTPEHPQYQTLRKVLADYRTMASKGGWPAVPPNVKLKAGQKSAHVGVIAKRLTASGDYEGHVPVSGEAAEYSATLTEAVKRFQRRHGLTDDGAVGAAVVAEMNVPIDQRIRQIELNLERWRWLPQRLGERYIIVNIPEYRLEVWDHDQVPVTMRVVVGKQDTPTPIFNDEMTHIVFSPYWNVPAAIAQGETLPEVLKDPAFLERANMEVVDAKGQPLDPATIDLTDPTQYRFRQRPGAQNSLGLVKFMFPNQFNVYLHDTPTDSLFARASRSFSHGCVRLEQPQALAEYVLRDQTDWTRERIEQAMHAGEERTVKLKTPIPVYLGYWTARVAADGVMQFRKDVYGIDGRQSALLAERLSRLRRTAAATTPSTRTDKSRVVIGNSSN